MSQYIIGYNNISWRPQDPHPKIWVGTAPAPGLTPIIGCGLKTRTPLDLAMETIYPPVNIW